MIVTDGLRMGRGQAISKFFLLAYDTMMRLAFFQIKAVQQISRGLFLHRVSCKMSSSAGPLLTYGVIPAYHSRFILGAE